MQYEVKSLSLPRKKRAHAPVFRYYFSSPKWAIIGDYLGARHYVNVPDP